MNLDVRTMYMAMGVACFIVAIAIFAFYTGRLRRDGALSWTVGWVLQGAFWALVGLRGLIWNFVSVVVATTLLAASFSFLYAAAQEFQGRTCNRKILLLPPVATFVFFWYFSTHVDNIFYRVIFISLLSILQITAIVWALFRDASIRERRSCRITGIAFLVMGGMWIHRLLEGFTLPYGHLSVLEATTFRNGSVLVGLGAVILSCIGFMFMTHERAEHTLREGEERLRQSEEKSRHLIKYAPSMIYEVDYNRAAFKSVNDAMCQALGYTREELLAKSPFDLLDDEGKALFRERIQRKLAGETVSDSVEYKSKTKDGREVYGVLNMTFTYKDGNPEGAVVVAHDITERKRMEKELRDHVRLLDDVIDGSTSPIFLKDKEGKFITINAALERMLGKSRQELKGKTDYDIAPKELADYWWSHDARVMATGKAIQIEEIADLPDGHHIFLANKFPLVDAHGQVYGVGAISHDITERKRAEEALRQSEQRWATTLASIGDGVITTDVDGRITFMNAVAESLTGWTLKDASQVSMTEVFRIINEQTRKEVENPITKVLRAGNVIGLGNHTLLIRKDGTEVAIDDSGAPIKDQDGKIMGVVLVFRDITERKAAEETLRASERKYRNLFENIEEMVTVYEVERDDGGRIVERRLRDANPAFLRAVGVSSVNEIREKTSSQIFGKVWSESHLPVVQEAMDTGQVQIQEVYRPESDRHYISSVVRLDKQTYLGTGRDITERKRAEEQLQAQRKTFEITINALPSGVGLYKGPDFVVELANPAYLAIASGRDVVGKRYKEVWPEAYPLVEPLLKQVLETGETYQAVDEKFSLRRSNGQLETRYFTWSLIRVRLPGEEGWGILNTVIETTEHKQAEEALRKSKERFEILSETASQLLTTEEPQNIVNELCQKVMTFLDCHAFFNYLVDEEKGRLHLNAYAGIPEETCKEIEWLDYGTAVCGCAARDASRIVCENIPTTPDPRTELVKSFGIKAYAAHPLISAGRVMGTLSFGTRSRATFTDEEVALMKTVADRVTIAMERTRLIEALRRSRDDLEVRVQERTAELAAINEELRVENEERLRVEIELRESENRLRELSSALLSAQERERKLIAGEIHDSLGASLAATKFKVETALKEMGKGNPQTKAALEGVIPIIQGTIEETRRIQMSLRPSMLDDLGILATINWFCRQYESIYPAIHVRKEIDIEEREVPESLKIVIYRVLQEALNNIAKHSKASVVLLHLQKAKEAIQLVIRDSGQGFDLEETSSRKGSAKGLGLDSMRERAELSGGSFLIESRKGAGTVIQATWPLNS